MLWDILHVSEYKQIERLGGLTNHTYKVELENDQIYVVRLPGEGTEELINRKDEQKSTQLAYQLGIDAKLIHFGTTGEKISCYIDGATTLSASSFCNSEILYKAAELLRELHTCGVDTNVPFDVFTMAASYERIIRENAIALFDGYEEVKAKIMKIREYTSHSNITSVPCHNDPLCENWVLGKNGKLYLIDWEYAGMNDGMWDLADISIEAGFSAEQDCSLLQFYFGRETSPDELFRFHANKLYLDFLWALWGKARVPFDGDSMEIYGQERYVRLTQNLNNFLKEFPLL